MDKTKILAEFIICGDCFDVDEITRALEIVPMKTRTKGVLEKAGKIPAVETSWEINTSMQESLDINVQLDQILDLLKDKVSILKELKAKLPISFNFNFAVYIENSESPSYYFEEKKLKFIAEIGGAIDIDQYIYS